MTGQHPQPRGPVNHPCDHPDCTAWGARGFDAPYGHKPARRPLWACAEHREWAEGRWRAKYGGKG